MNIDLDLAKIAGWVVASLASVLLFFFKRELSSIDARLNHIDKKLELTEKEMQQSVKGIESEIAVNKSNITLNSAKDEEFKKFLNEKFDRLFGEIEQLKHKK